MKDLHEKVLVFMLMDLVEHALLTSEEAELTKKIYFAKDNKHLNANSLDDNGKAA